MSVYERHALSNGLRVLTAPLGHAQSVACYIFLNAGSRYEDASNRGIAHFAEHMFFKGTERRPTAKDISLAVEGMGGEFNAFTSKEYTAYYIRCAGEQRDTALDVLVDMVRHSRFDPEEIDREKGVIVEEMNMYIDTPRDYVGSVYEELLFGSNPLGWETLGTKATVTGATRKTFTDYIDHWYTPQRMVVGVAGMVGDDLLPRLEELLGDLGGNGADAPLPADLPDRRRAARPHPPEGLRPGPGLPRRAELPARASRPVRAAAAGDGARRRDVVAPVPRGARAARAGLLHLRLEQLVHRRGDALLAGRRRPRPGRRGGQGDRRAVPARSRTNACRTTSWRRPARSPRAGSCCRRRARTACCSSACAARCSRVRPIEPEELLSGLDAVTADDIQRVAQDVIGSHGLNLALVGPFDDEERFAKLLA